MPLPNSKMTIYQPLSHNLTILKALCSLELLKKITELKALSCHKLLNLKNIKCLQFFQFSLRGWDIAIFSYSIDYIKQMPLSNLKIGYISAHEPKLTKLKGLLLLKLLQSWKNKCLRFFNFTSRLRMCFFSTSDGIYPIQVFVIAIWPRLRRSIRVNSDFYCLLPHPYFKKDAPNFKKKHVIQHAFHFLEILRHVRIYFLY